VGVGVEKVKEAVGIATVIVPVLTTDSDRATTTGVEDVSVGTIVERGKVILGENDVRAVLVAATEEADADRIDSGMAGEYGMLDSKSKDTTVVPVKFPTIKSRPRLYPFLTMSCPSSIGSSTEALPRRQVNQIAGFG
jgi:hypothetical protein